MDTCLRGYYVQLGRFVCIGQTKIEKYRKSTEFIQKEIDNKKEAVPKDVDSLLEISILKIPLSF